MKPSTIISLLREEAETWPDMPGMPGSMIRQMLTDLALRIEAFSRSICRDTVDDLNYGTTLYNKWRTNADGSPMRARVSGKVKVWDTRPDEFSIPMKYGLSHSFRITQDNAHEWTKDEEEAKAAINSETVTSGG